MATAPEVEVVQVEQKDVPIYGEWIGTLDGMVNAEIKAQVTGYLLKQHYTEASFATKGSCSLKLIRALFRGCSIRSKGSSHKLIVSS